ncbi:MAG TPA: hypothetical protein VG603_03280 [Chitinophagales bacterium]|nr:hypothetical protein [Chitinophagales bacterium]
MNKLIALTFLTFAAIILPGCKTKPPVTTSPVPVRSVPHEQVTVHGRPSPYPTIPITDFTGNWKGDESCFFTNTPSSIIITAKDSVSVYIVNYGGSPDMLTGNAKGYLIIVMPQQIRINGTVTAVSGKFVLDNERRTMRSFVTLKSESGEDTCNLILHR